MRLRYQASEIELYGSQTETVSLQSRENRQWLIRRDSYWQRGKRRWNRRRKVFVSVPLSRFSCGKIVFCLRSLPQFKLNGRQIRLTQIDSPVRLTVSWQGLIKEKKAWPERHKNRPFEFKVFKQEFWHVLRSKNYGNRGKLHVLLFSEFQSDVEVGAHLNSPTIKFRSH